MLIMRQISQSSLTKGHFQLSVELYNFVKDVLVTPVATLKTEVCFFCFLHITVAFQF
jgi:hypothetical protein